jgi:hypothetical protein
MNNNLKFSVTVPVKPYVKRFLEINYGSPVDFSLNAEAHKFFRNLLHRPDTSSDRKYSDHICNYTEFVEVSISEHDFYRYGWELTKTNIVAFGQYFEDHTKLMMRNIVGVHIGLGMPINKSIIKFQNRFLFDEDTWPYQTIKKDFYRNGRVEIIDFDQEIFNKIQKLILRNLYNLGTLSVKAIHLYETSE